MKASLIKLGIISALVLVCCGWGKFVALWDGIRQAFTALFPFIREGIKDAFEEYITSPYFIAGAIMMVASCFGIRFGKRWGKKLYVVVSIIGAVASLASMSVSIL